MRKTAIRKLSLLLCLAMVFSLIGCTQTPAVSENLEEPTVPVETEPSPQDLYSDGIKAIDDAKNLEIQITISEKRTVGAEVYTDQVTEKLSLQGLDGDSLIASAKSTYKCCEGEFSSEEYYDGTKCYLIMNGQPFSGELTREEYLARFVPAILLDSSLYSSVSAKDDTSGTVLTFQDPTAAETWAMPEYGALVKASGKAVLNGEGTVTSTTYSIEYTLGAIVVEMDVTADIKVLEAMSLTNTLTPAEEEYIPLSYIDTPLLMLQALHNIQQSESVTFASTETIISAAAAVYLSNGITYDIYGTGEDLLANIEKNVTLADLSTGKSQSSSGTENFQKGKYTFSSDGSDPVSQNVNASVVEAICRDALINSLKSPELIASAEISDLGSVYYLEMTGSEAMAEELYREASVALFSDEDLLDDYAEAYEVVSMDLYLSIDKFTELPVAYGYYYEGMHTIEGQECQFSYQGDYSYFLSSNTSYETITEELLPDVEPEDKPTPLFYHVTGEDGQEMWLFGTIHLGDDRTAYLPQEIYTALENADALAVEFDTDAFTDLMETDDSLQDQVYDTYVYEDNSETKEHLDEEVYEAASKLMKATGNNYSTLNYLKAYHWGQTIDQFYVQQGYDLQFAKGVDNRLLKIARDKGIEIRDIESGLFQSQMVNGYSDELQQVILEETLESNTLEYCASVRELYEYWCDGDEAVLREEISDEVDTSELTEEELAEYEQLKPLIDQYNKIMSYDRNDGMLEVAIGYLESGETVFYAVGLAHLLDSYNGLVVALREAGYTVELVQYS